MSAVTITMISETFEVRRKRRNLRMLS